MVKTKSISPFDAEGRVDLELWLSDLERSGYAEEMTLIRNACALAYLAGGECPTETSQSCYVHGLAMAEILTELQVDAQTLAAAIIFESVHYTDLSIEDVKLQLGDAVAKLVMGVEKMSALSILHAQDLTLQNKQQLDNIRKMLLAMVEDVRVVLIKLAERLSVLRALVLLPPAIQQPIAIEVMALYAPLANRLSIGALKWTLEDYAFRYTHPDDYKTIAKALKTKRLERDEYVNEIVSLLIEQLHAQHLQHVEVYGRAKHIHSIYRKMQRKQVPVEEIYDAIAVRVLVETEADCYEALSVVHSLWKPISDEFDDYIVNPKPNGYRSLHTAVVGSRDRVFEVQIRTHRMHQLAEMGIAAHWKYKEGGGQTAHHERRIDWLRDVLAWHRDVAKNQGISESLETEFLEDRVYVFTPEGDILDLPQGATSLDFAYHVHTEIGHRCRGAKVNGKMVSLTESLKTGDRVEVLTGRDAKPSRDWINPHLHYLKSSRAKAKVLHWFKMQDFEKNRLQGRELLDAELKMLALKMDNLTDITKALGFKFPDDLLAALGRGDIKLSQIIGRIPTTNPLQMVRQHVVKPQTKPDVGYAHLKIEGVGNLLTNMAKCCKPLPGDEVIGYVTRGRGVSIHRQDCLNIIHATEKQKDRFLTVSWGNAPQSLYRVDILIKAYSRVTLLRDVTAVLANEKVRVIALQIRSDETENLSYLNATLEVESLENLSKLFTKIKQIPNVLSCTR